jgi:hypothetical protein
LNYMWGEGFIKDVEVSASIPSRHPNLAGFRHSILSHLDSTYIRANLDGYINFLDHKGCRVYHYALRTIAIGTWMTKDLEKRMSGRILRATADMMIL